jgi:hypothetical protein
MQPVRHVQLALHAIALLSVGLAASATPALAQTPTMKDAPDVRLDLDIETGTGEFTAGIVFQAPSGVVALPVAEWLTMDELSFFASDVPIELPEDGRIDPKAHRNEDLRIELSGRFPARNGDLTAVMWSAEASHVVGPAWFPTDDVAVRDHEASITNPAGRVVAATGTLVSEGVESETRHTQVAFTGRSEDFGLFIGPYVVEETDHRDLRLRTYFEDADPELSQRYFTATAGYLDRYQAEIGPYPYDGFSVVAAPFPVGLGFAGLTYVSREILSHPYMQGRSLAHEVLHSWWGNAVGVDYDTGNWAEGLTTFQADYALAQDTGNEAARDMRVRWIRDLDSLDAAEMQPLTAFRSASHAVDQSEGYGKASMVFLMLRDHIGPDVFSDGIAAFYRDNRNAIAGWRDLQHAFESASGSDLEWFFDQWVKRAGLPRVRITEVSWHGMADGPGELVATIRQDAPHYRVNLPIEMETASGIERRRTEVRDGVSVARFALKERPKTIRLDPDFEVPRRPLDGELAPILRSLAGVSRIEAVAASPMDLEASVEEAMAPLVGDKLTWTDSPNGSVEEAAILVAGLSGDVAKRRPESMGPLPAMDGEGATRLWIERGADGKLWTFLTFERLEDIATDLRALRYYTGQSHVTFEAGRAVGGGVWPASETAGAVRLTDATEDEAKQ